MSKRNVILLIVILLIATIVAFGFFYLYQPKNTTTGTTEGTNFFANFIPFGNKNSDTNTNTGTQPVDVSGYIPPSDQTDVNNAKLKKISSFPVAGFGMFMKERFKDIQAVVPTEQIDSRGKTIAPTPPSTEFMPALRYVNKATGIIYQTFVDKIDERKFSGTIIPKVYEAYFGNKGGTVVMRYLKGDNKTIETFVGALPKEYLGADSIGTSEITGSFLPENITDISISPDASNMFYLFNSGDNAVGVTYSLQDNTKTQVFSSPFTEWLSSWSTNNLITVTSKPSVNVPGFAYVINSSKKDFNKLMGNINGLTTLASPDGKMVLYGDDNLSLSIFNTNTGSSTLLGVKTLPEKCTWGSASDIIYCAVPKSITRAQYPDSWYQGEVSFSDSIWKIDVASGSTTMISDPSEDIDGIKLSLDGNQNYLLFMNKKDSYLWELGLQ